jgi:uncharacterized protein (TIGR02246 family)
VTHQEPIQELLDDYEAAVAAKDVDAFVALYDNDVRVFDAFGSWSHDGAGEWRRTVAEWFGSVGNDRIAVEFHEVDTIIGVGVAAAHAIVTFKGLTPDGEELRAIHNRLTWTLRQTQEGAWRIVHEHTSVPIDVETSKPVPRSAGGVRVDAISR